MPNLALIETKRITMNHSSQPFSAFLTLLSGFFTRPQGSQYLKIHANLSVPSANPGS